MKIRKRHNGLWVMEHCGVEAPYDVVEHTPGKFTVYYDDDESDENPVASLEGREIAETLTIKHYRGISQ